MAKGLIGKKLGMTQVFTRDGRCVPVTVVEVGPCVVLQKKEVDGDGYTALQVGFGKKDILKKTTTKAMKGHFAKAGKGAFSKLAEFRSYDVSQYEVGQEIGMDLFSVGEKVHVTGTSKGHGFQGVIKRHGFRRGPETHGSHNHRVPGSIGQCAYPSKVFKGHKMPGHMGDERVTIKNLEIVDVDSSKNLLLLKGSIPGGNNNYILIKKSK